jgi:nucleotide-binding universal stress UspA family protein
MTDTKYVILVGIDYSEASELALAQALEFARNKPQVELHAVNVQLAVADARALLDPKVPEMSLAGAATNLQGHVARAVTAFQVQTGCTPFSKLTTHLRLYEPAHQIAQLAADIEADLVVIGTRSRGGLSRFFMGSVAEEVLRLAPCPVLVVRAKATPVPLPQIEPPCPRCMEARIASQGAELWCEQHREHHGQRHTYHQRARSGEETNFPLVVSP